MHWALLPFALFPSKASNHFSIFSWPQWPRLSPASPHTFYFFPRRQELKDVHHKDQMAAARGVLQRNIPMLYTASRACLQHPDVAAYKANRDLIYKQLQSAVSGISNAAQATATEDSALHPAGGGELAYALNNFDVSPRTVHALFLFGFIWKDFPSDCMSTLIMKLFTYWLTWLVGATFGRRSLKYMVYFF